MRDEFVAEQGERCVQVAGGDAGEHLRHEAAVGGSIGHGGPSGREADARQTFRAAAPRPGLAVVAVGDGPGGLVTSAGRPFAALGLEFDGDRISAARVVLNPVELPATAG